MEINTTKNITPISEAGIFTYYKYSSGPEKCIIKALSARYRNEKYNDIPEKEFRKSSGIKHPNILHPIELKEIPGLGNCIILENAELETIDNMLENNRITPKLLTNLQYNLIDTIAFLQEYDIPHKLERQCIMIDRESLVIKIIDTGSADEYTESDDIIFFGNILNLALSKLPGKYIRLNSIVNKCIKGDYQNIGDLQIALEKQSSNSIYIPIIILLAILLSTLYWLNRL